MSETNSIFKAMLRQPVSFAILVLSIVILIVWFDYKSTLQHNQSMGVSPSMGDSMSNVQAGSQGSSISPPIQLSAPGSQPSIMGQVDGGANSTGAPAIDSLVGGLEAKVKADPDNLDNRILLAQTYRELGRKEDATRELRGILKQDSENARAKLVLASILSQSDDGKELKESLKLLSNISSDARIRPYMIDLYRGDAYSRQNNSEGALKNWKQALATMPKSDVRYSALEKKVMDLSKDATPKAPAGS